MNKNAIKDAHTLFTQAGYRGSQDDFLQLIATNDDALNDAFELFRQHGYAKTKGDFAALMGIQPSKKKVGGEPPQKTTPPQGKESLSTSPNQKNPSSSSLGLGALSSAPEEFQSNYEKFLKLKGVTPQMMESKERMWEQTPPAQKAQITLENNARNPWVARELEAVEDREIRGKGDEDRERYDIGYTQKDRKYYAFPLTHPDARGRQRAASMEEAFAVAEQNGELIPFNTEEEAEYFARQGFQEAFKEKTAANYVNKMIDRKQNTPREHRNQLAAGSLRLAAGITGAPQFAMEIMSLASPIGMSGVTLTDMGTFEGEYNPLYYLNKWKGDLIVEAQKADERVRQANPEIEKGIVGAFKEGDIALGFHNMMSTAMQSLPVTLGMMATGGAGAPVIIGVSTVVLGGMEMAEADVNAGVGTLEQMKEWEGRISAADAEEAYGNLDRRSYLVLSAFLGAIEGTFETYLGAGAAGNMVKRIIKAGGTDVVEQGMKRGFRNAIADYLIDNPHLQWAGEIFEEMGTQFSQNAIEKISGADPEKGILDGVLEAGLGAIPISAGQTAIVQGTRGAKKAYQKHIDKKTEKLVTEYSDFDAVMKSPISPVRMNNWAEYQRRLGRISEEEYIKVKETASARAHVERLLTSDGSEVDNAVGKRLGDLMYSQKELSKDEVIKKAHKEELSAIDAEIAHIVKNKSLPEGGIDLSNTLAKRDTPPPRYEIAGKKMSRREFIKRANRMTAAALLDTKIENDPRLQAAVKKRMAHAAGEVGNKVKDYIDQMSKGDVIASMKENGEITMTDENGNLCAAEGMVLSFSRGGKWSIVDDYKGVPTHEGGGHDVIIEGEPIEVEKDELRIQNSFGDTAIIPDDYRAEVMDAIKEGCYGCIDGIVSSLPVAPKKAQDGAVIGNDDPPEEYGKEQRDEFLQYMMHPAYKGRLAKEMFGDIKLTKQQQQEVNDVFNARIEQIKNVPILPKPEGGGVFMLRENRVESSTDVINHELTHASDWARDIGSTIPSSYRFGDKFFNLYHQAYGDYYTKGGYWKKKIDEGLEKIKESEDQLSALLNDPDIRGFARTESPDESKGKLSLLPKAKETLGRIQEYIKESELDQYDTKPEIVEKAQSIQSYIDRIGYAKKWEVGKYYDSLNANEIPESGKWYNPDAVHEDIPYFKKPTEIRARLTELRMEAARKYGYDQSKPFRIEDYPELKKHRAYSELQHSEVMDDATLNKFMEYFAFNSNDEPIYGDGQTLKAKDGLVISKDDPPKKVSSKTPPRVPISDFAHGEMTPIDATPPKSSDLGTVPDGDGFFLPQDVRERLYLTVAPSSYPFYPDDPIRGKGEGEEEPYYQYAAKSMLSGQQRAKSMEDINKLAADVKKFVSREDWKDFTREYEKRLTAGQDISKVLEKHKGLLDEYSQLEDVIYDVTGGFSFVDEDLWRQYLGMPKISNEGVVKSPYKPSRGKNPKTEYYTLGKDFTPHMFWSGSEEAYMRHPDDNPSFREHIFSIADGFMKDGSRFPVVAKTHVTGLENATLDKGRDERGDYFSIYDTYDFDVVGEKAIGKPFEIYDRVYYKKYPDGKMKVMYYTDDELKDMKLGDPIDYVSLGEELRNRGYDAGTRQEDVIKVLDDFQKTHKEKK